VLDLIALLGESQGRRAREQAQAAARLRRRALLLAGASSLAAILAAIVFLAFRQSNQNAQPAQIASARAEQGQAAAEAQAKARATQQALGKRLLTGSGDATARVWDVLTGEVLLTLKVHSSTIFWLTDLARSRVGRTQTP
jgi:hypothetical protein